MWKLLRPGTRSKEVRTYEQPMEASEPRTSEQGDESRITRQEINLTACPYDSQLASESPLTGRPGVSRPCHQSH